MKWRTVILVCALCSAADSATIRGHVHDTKGLVIPGVTIEFRSTKSSSPTIVQSDGTGSFTVTALGSGTYSIHATKNALAADASVTIESADPVPLDLILKPETSSVEFSDDPNFVVAGVTDNTYMGSHGSDAGPRTAEDLSKATATLATKTPPASKQSEADLLAKLAAEPANPALHHALGEFEEHSGKPLDAVRELQRAAELKPDEANIFDWGAELLSHGAPQAAAQVFDKGITSFPKSTRMSLGAAVAYYAQSDYSKAADRFFQASDLNPKDPQPYLFLARVQQPQITASSAYLDRMRRFAERNPNDAQAQYYLAMALLQHDPDPGHPKQLLSAAVKLNPAFAEAHLQLGILYFNAGDLGAAIDEYKKAIAADPASPQAHYRLAAAYRKSGDIAGSARESELFRQLEATAVKTRADERAQLQRFVITLKSPAQ